MATSIEDRVRKLLMLHRHNSNRAEAEAALLKAQELMVEHAISEEKVADLLTPKSKDVHEYMWAKAQPEAWERNLGNIVAKNFRCKSVWVEGTGIGIWGHPEDLLVAVAVFEAALEAAKDLLHTYMLSKDYLPEVRSYRSMRTMHLPLNVRERRIVRLSFLNGFVLGLGERYTKQVESMNYGLIVVTPVAVAQHIEKALGKTQQVRSRKAYVYTSVRQIGRARGHEFSPVTAPKLLD